MLALAQKSFQTEHEALVVEPMSASRPRLQVVSAAESRRAGLACRWQFDAKQGRLVGTWQHS